LSEPENCRGIEYCPGVKALSLGDYINPVADILDIELKAKTLGLAGTVPTQRKVLRKVAGHTEASRFFRSMGMFCLSRLMFMGAAVANRGSAAILPGD